VARILIVDDEPFVRDLVRATLDFGEHEIFEAKDGPAALELVAGKRPDLVLLDLGLPGALSGLDVLKRLTGAAGDKSSSAAGNARIRIIVLTGSGGEHETATREAGATAFLTKPFSPLQLISCVEAALEPA